MTLDEIKNSNTPEAQDLAARIGATRHGLGSEIVRTVDALERIAKALETMTDPNVPVNVYGEGLSEAIQNSIARGLRGMDVPR